MLLAALLPVLAFAQPGTLDGTFGTDGIVRTDPGGGNAWCVKVLQAPSGALYGAGTYFNSNMNTDFALAKYDANGNLDASFGTAGIATAAVGTSNDNCYTAALQVDGKVLLGGDYVNASGGYNFAVVRFLADGTLDPSFGSGGIATVDMGTTDNYGQALAVQADGKILLAGRHNEGTIDYIVMRFNANGTLDSGFGNAGIRIQAVGTSTDNCYDVAVQADGKIILAGDILNGSNWDAALVRLTAGGQPDASFGSNGIAIHALSDLDDYVYGVHVQADGKIVVGGQGQHPTFDRMIARFLPDGSLDSGFGTGGVTFSDFGGVEGGFAVAEAADGTFFVPGSSTTLGFTLSHYFADGTLDAGFGDAGQVATFVPDGFNTVSSVLVDAEQRVLVCGNARDPVAVDTRFIILRYHYNDVTGIAEQAAATWNASLSPDPITTASTLRFTLDHAGQVSAVVFDAAGRAVARPWSGRGFGAGEQAIAVSELSALKPGRYVLVLIAGDRRVSMPFVNAE